MCFVQRLADHLRPHVILPPRRSNLHFYQSLLLLLRGTTGLSDEIHRCLFHHGGMWRPIRISDKTSAQLFSLDTMPKEMDSFKGVCLDLTWREVPVFFGFFWHAERQSSGLKYTLKYVHNRQDPVSSVELKKLKSTQPHPARDFSFE